MILARMLVASEVFMIKWDSPFYGKCLKLRLNIKSLHSVLLNSRKRSKKTLVKLLIGFPPDKNCLPHRLK